MGRLVTSRALTVTTQPGSTENVTLAVEPTMQGIEDGIIGGNEWFEVLPLALDQGAWIVGESNRSARKRTTRERF